MIDILHFLDRATYEAKDMAERIENLENLLTEMFPDLEVLDGFTESIALKEKICYLMGWNDGQYAFTGEKDHWEEEEGQ